MAIIINNKIRFGKPIIAGTRITISEVLGALAGGMTYKEIEEEYGISKGDIIDALKYVVKLLSEKKIGEIKQ